MKARLPQSSGGLSGNPQNMMRQIQKMQDDMAAKEAELAARTHEISAGGGAVTLTITGEKVVTELKIAPEIVDPEDIETLSDIIIAAFNEGIKRVGAIHEQEIGKITAGMPNIPGLF